MCTIFFTFETSILKFVDFCIFRLECLKYITITFGLPESKLQKNFDFSKSNENSINIKTLLSMDGTVGSGDLPICH